MSKTPKHSAAATKAHPAPRREDFTSGKDYAIACMRVCDERIAFDTPSALTDKQERFAVERVKTGSQSAAYRIAYDTSSMTDKQVWEEASKLSANPKVSQRVNELRKQAADTAMMTSAEVLQEAMRLARFDIRKLYRDDGSPIPIQELDDETAAAVQAVEILEVYEYDTEAKQKVFVGYTKKYKVADKNAALEKLFKHFGLYEKDNAQKNDPIREFLNQCSGKSLPIAP